MCLLQNAYVISWNNWNLAFCEVRGIRLQEILIWRVNFKWFCCCDKSATQLEIVCVTPGLLEALPSLRSKGMFNFMEENPLFLLSSLELKQALNIFFLQSCLYQWLVCSKDAKKCFLWLLQDVPCKFKMDPSFPLLGMLFSPQCVLGLLQAIFSADKIVPEAAKNHNLH